MNLSDEEFRAIREQAAKRADAGGAQPSIEWHLIAFGVAIAAWVLLLIFAGAILPNPREASEKVAGFALAAGALAGAAQWLRGWLWQRRYDRAYDEGQRELAHGAAPPIETDKGEHAAGPAFSAQGKVKRGR